MSKIFICFIGIDGSGKSTLSQNIFVDMNMKNKKVRKTYGRYQPRIGKFLMSMGKKLFLDDVNMFRNYDEYLDSKKNLFKKTSRLAKLYINLILLEYYFEIMFKIILPMKFGYSIVSDRYVHDTIINDVAVDMDLSSENVNQLLEKFWNFVPKPNITFYLKVPEEIAQKRKNDIPSLNYLKIRNKFYNELVNYEKIVVLDGTANPSELKKRVYQEMGKLL